MDTLSKLLAFVTLVSFALGSWAITGNHWFIGDSLFIIGILVGGFDVWLVIHNAKNEQRLVKKEEPPRIESAPKRTQTELKAESQPSKPLADPRLEYTEDVFNNIIWRWQYNAHIDQTPRNLHAYCIECRQPMKQTGILRGHGGYFIQVTCQQHKFDHITTNSSGDFIDIKKQIQKKLQDGSWLGVVNRQRITKGQLTISVPLEAKTVASPQPVKLDEIAEQILTILWVHREVAATSEVGVFVAAFHFVRSQENKPDIDRALLEHHLTNLVNEDYIDLEMPDMVERYSLRSKGQKYFIDNSLRDAALFRSLRTLIDQVAEPPHIDTLDEIKTKLLKTIALYDSCRIYELESALNAALHIAGKSLLVTANIKHHLDQLKEDKFIKIYPHTRRSETYHLDKRGQKFLTDNHLWPKPPMR